jgi:hypothetical protein
MDAGKGDLSGTEITCREVIRARIVPDNPIAFPPSMEVMYESGVPKKLNTFTIYLL